MYEVIDKRLNIKACSTNDLTYDDIQSPLKAFYGKRILNNMTVFCRSSTGEIIVNKDNQHFEDVLEVVTKYLGADDVKREEYKFILRSNFTKDIIDIVDIALEYRKKIDFIDMLDHNEVPIEFIPTELCFSAINRFKWGLDDLSIALYKYGFIQGKRAERKRRKKALEVNKWLVLAIGLNIKAKGILW